MSSVQPQRSASKTAAKRRAENRRVRRERLRIFASVFFIFIFVCGTVALVFPQSFTIPQQSQTNLPATTPAPGVVDPNAGIQQPTPMDNAVTQLVQQGDTAFDAGDWVTAASRYKAAIGLSPGNATLHFKAGKAFINNKDYTNGVAQLQMALAANPNASFAAEAQSLIEQHQGQVTPGAGGSTDTGNAGTAPITSTNPITP
jgi:predicted Zn-dependent protease